MLALESQACVRRDWNNTLQLERNTINQLEDWTLKLFGVPDHSNAGEAIELSAFLKVTQDKIGNFDGVTRRK